MTGGRVENNTVNATNDSDGIYVYAPDCTPFNVANNTVTNSLYYGFDLYLNGATISGNTASQNGYPYSYGGFYVSGDGNRLSQNIATNNGEDGFEIYGCGNTLSYNQARNNLDDGFQLDTAGCTSPHQLRPQPGAVQPGRGDRPGQ